MVLFDCQIIAFLGTNFNAIVLSGTNLLNPKLTYIAQRSYVIISFIVNRGGDLPNNAKFFNLPVISLLLAVVLVVSLFATSVSKVPIARAASTITVNSTADTVADDGKCTLREAIISANTDTASGASVGECVAGSGADTINFAITGTADFTNGGQNGYTIKPNSALPDITTQITIDGYSQPGAQANTAIAPNPLNGRLLIELDGVFTNSTAFSVRTGGNNVQIKGLIIARFAGNGVNVIGASNLKIQGNYIGTDYTGMIAHPTGINDVSSSTAVSVGDGFNNLATDYTTSGTVIGGLNPADRNLISGNYGGAIGVGSYDTTIQGNYIGVKANGVEALANSTGSYTTGNPTVDYADKVLIGGPSDSATNVISGNNSGAIQPDQSINVMIENNIIGTDYTKTLDLGNAANGVSFTMGTAVSIDGIQMNTVKDNTIAFSNNNGLWLNQTDTAFVISGNTVYNNQQSGIAISGNSSDITAINNLVHDSQQSGIAIAGASNIDIDSNIVYNGGFMGNIQISGYSGFGAPTDTVTVKGNKIGIKPDNTPGGNNSFGINITGDPTNVTIGGTSSSDANIISANTNAGIGVMSLTVSAMGASIALDKVSILGNSIYANEPGAYGQGLGIDLFEGIDTDNPPDGAPNSFNEVGPTLNDPGDNDLGPNNYINFPVINSATQDGTKLKLNLDLDAKDSPTNQYRVEVFANDTADPSGYGEGQTFLGFANLSPGSNQAVELTLPNTANLTGKVLSTTTTAVDSTTSSGFGSTSEFSKVANVDIISLPKADATTALADTGDNVFVYILEAMVFFGLGLWLSYSQIRRERLRQARFFK